jgi:hypothetical protein
VTTAIALNLSANGQLITPSIVEPMTTTETRHLWGWVLLGGRSSFRRLDGVIDTSVGYMGGHFEHPCYLDVLSRITGHAEVCQVQFDPAEISYALCSIPFGASTTPPASTARGAIAVSNTAQ